MSCKDIKNLGPEKEMDGSPLSNDFLLFRH